MTLAELRASLRKRIGNPTTTDVPDVDLNEYINESNQYINDTFAFRASRPTYNFNTVAGTFQYDLPDDVSVLMRVGNRTKQYRLKRRESKFQYDHEDQLTSEVGEPKFYYVGISWIHLYPIPDAVYAMALFYNNIAEPLVADGDTSVIPSTWHSGIVRYARYLFYDINQDFAKAQYAYAAWALWLQNKPNELQDELVYDSDFGVEIPGLRPSRDRLDWDHSD